MLAIPKRRILRWDPYLEPGEDDMEFRLTYAGELLAHRDDWRIRDRPYHVHKIRQCFHHQLIALWANHPVLMALEASKHFSTINLDGFNWRPMVTKDNGLICKLEIVMLRIGPPGQVLADIDNRLKTLFDALRMPHSPDELGAKSSKGQIVPQKDEDPFFVLLQDDRLITHIAVTTDTLLESVQDVTGDNAARLYIAVTVRPYHTHMDNLDYV